MDHIIYGKIFNYLYENFNFYPSIIYTDLKKVLQVAIKNNKYFGNIAIHTKCLFHFSQIIKRQLKKNIKS